MYFGLNENVLNQIEFIYQQSNANIIFYLIPEIYEYQLFNLNLTEEYNLNSMLYSGVMVFVP